MSDEELTKLEEALKKKDENTIIEITLSHTSEERYQIREAYTSKFGHDLIEDLKKYTKSDLSETLQSIYKEPIEYDADLLYKAMKGIGTNDDILIEVITFRSFEKLTKVKQKFQEKYSKDLISQVKSETSGEYRNGLVTLLEKERSTNNSPDLENCKRIAEELYKAGEGKIGTNDKVFVEYWTTLSGEELSLVGKEYHKDHAKTLINVVENEFSGKLKKLLINILYATLSPSEYFARQINKAIKGVGTDDTTLIRSIVSRMDIDMNLIKKYYKKLFKKDMASDIKGDTSGNYQKVLLHLIGES